MGDLLTPIIDGFAHLSTDVLLFLLIGVVVGQVIAVIPGLGGIFGIAILLPFTYGLSPDAAVAMIIGVAVTSGTGNTITAVLFGVPGSPTGLATVFDGYPMAKRGEAARAIAAGLTASVVGGVLGAILLAVLMPFARPLTLALGPPEFFVLIVVALVFMAYVRAQDVVKALVSGGFGLMLAFVGQELSTATVRYTFGQFYLWDGIKLVPFMIGLFAISEMLILHQKGTRIASEAQSDSGSGLTQGIRDVFVHWRTTLQSSWIGGAVGLVPGLGGETAQFLAYSKAARGQAKHRAGDRDFGDGSVRGVIASDAATNSKDGGALVPTLAFGIPGSASMALLLVAFMQLGIRPGQQILAERPDVVWMIILLLLFSNVLAVLVCLGAVPWAAKLTFVRPSLIIPAILAISIFGAYATSGHVGDIITAIAAGVIGYYLVKYRYSRVLLVIGVVLGGSLEQNYLLATRLFGWGFLARPFTILLVAFLVVAIVWPVVARQWKRRTDVVPEPRVGSDRE